MQIRDLEPVEIAKLPEVVIAGEIAEPASDGDKETVKISLQNLVLKNASSIFLTADNGDKVRVFVKYMGTPDGNKTYQVQAEFVE